MVCGLCGADIAVGSGVCPACGSVAEMGSDSLALPIGFVLADRFVVERVLGEGGFGITYQMLDKSLDVRVAVKELVPTGSRRGDSMRLVQRGTSPAELSVERFVREAKALRMVRHQSVVQVYDFFEANGTAYLVMELLAGETLEIALRREGAWPESKVVALAEELGGALDAVHAQGFLHRDIKPGNVILVPNRGAVLIDFGSVRTAAADGGSALTQLVTHGYAPLEQYQSRGVIGPYTDLYALGAVLYEALVGRPVSSATDRASFDDVRPMREVVPGLETSLPSAIDAALRVKPADRPQTVAEFLGLLHAPAATAFDAASLERPAPLPSNAPGRAPSSGPPPVVDKQGGGRRLGILIALAFVVVAGVGAAVALLGGGSSDSASDANATVTTDAAVETTGLAGAESAPTPVAESVLATTAAPTTTKAPILFDTSSPKIGLIFQSNAARSVAFAEAVRAAVGRQGSPGTSIGELAVVECDTAPGSRTAADCATEWASRNDILGVVGPTSSADAASIVDLYRANIPVLLAGTTRRALTVPRTNASVFRLTASDYQIGAAAGTAANAVGTRAFIYNPTSPTGPDAAQVASSEDGFRSTFTGTVVGRGSTLTLPDASSFDVVFTNDVRGEDVTAVLSELVRGTWRGTIISSPEVFAGFVGKGCSLKTSAVRCQAVDIGYKGSRQVVDWSVVGADAVKMLVNAYSKVLSAAGAPSSTTVWSSIVAGLDGSSFSGATATYQFDSNGDNSKASVVIYRHNGSGWTLPA